jgi:hypothetical protein
MRRPPIGPASPIPTSIRWSSGPRNGFSSGYDMQSVEFDVDIESWREQEEAFLE